jgi:hypothetical protein
MKNFSFLFVPYGALMCQNGILTFSGVVGLCTNLCMKCIPFSVRMIQGAIAKTFVVKHYRHGVVVTRYPNMKGIVASPTQQMSRRLFKKAVLYAQQVYANPALKSEKTSRLRRPRRLFQALMKEWFAKRKEKACRCERRRNCWTRNVLINGEQDRVAYLHERCLSADSWSANKMLLTGKDFSGGIPCSSASLLH